MSYITLQLCIFLIRCTLRRIDIIQLDIHILTAFEHTLIDNSKKLIVFFAYYILQTLVCSSIQPLQGYGVIAGGLVRREPGRVRGVSAHPRGPRQGSDEVA